MIDCILLKFWRNFIKQLYVGHSKSIYVSEPGGRGARDLKDNPCQLYNQGYTMCVEGGIKEIIMAKVRHVG